MTIINNSDRIICDKLYGGTFLNSISYKTALGGVIASLCLMLMFLTSLSPVFYLVMPMFAGMLILVVKFETDNKWALLTYFAVSILSALITFNKESVLMFIMFFGYYPLFKQSLDRIKFSPLRAVVKTVLYNSAIIGETVLVFVLFGITDMLDEIVEMGQYGLLIMLGVSNLMFVVYDISLASCELMYKSWFRPKILCKK